MAAPIILQAMWLFLVSAVSAGLDTRSLQRDFPQLAHVVYSICGLTDIDFTVSHPCQYAIFGMAYAFTECSVHHQTAVEEFKSCVSGCSVEDKCAHACADPAVKNPDCLSQCTLVKGCIQQATSLATGMASAKTELQHCFETQAPPPKIVVTHSAVQPAVQPAVVAPGSPAAAVVASPAPAAQIMPPSPAPAASAPLGSFKVRKGTVKSERGVVDRACICTATGIVRETNTGQIGCEKHGKEANAVVEAYCYIEGGYQCGGAMTSDLFPGLFWVGCEKPDLNALYPPMCEILTRSEAKLFEVPVPLGLKVPPNSFENSTRDMSPLPAAQDPLEAMRNGMATWTGALPPVWHESRQGFFKDGPFQNGPVVPAGPAPAVMMPASPAAAVPAVPAAPAVVAMIVDKATPTAISQLRGVQHHSGKA